MQDLICKTDQETNVIEQLKSDGKNPYQIVKMEWVVPDFGGKMYQKYTYLYEQEMSDGK